MAAISYGSVSRVKEAIDAGANVNIKDPGGITPLMHVAEYGVLDNGQRILQYLLDGGADVNMRSNSGKTTLDYARSKGNTKAIQMLLQHKR